MRAFVFSGGANRGALQAGATLALMEAGIFPDMVVGSSVGSINAAAVACYPTLEGVRHVSQHWRSIRREDIFPGNPLAAAWRLLRGHGSLHTNHALRRFILQLLTPTRRRFEDLLLPLYVTATRFDNGELHLFGTDPRERIVDALMASSAVPPYLPPYRYRGNLYLDGGFVSNLPISVAIEQGATEIWALEIGVDALAAIPSAGLRSTLARSVETLMRLQMLQEVELVRSLQQHTVTIHHIQMLHYSGMDLRDFRHSEALIDLGYESAQLYLNERRQLPTVALPQPTPRRIHIHGRIQDAAQRQRHVLQARAEALRTLWQRRSSQTVPVEIDIGPSAQQHS